jgi:hypothetical protein
MFGMEQGWETNRKINYQLINSWGITLHVFPIWDSLGKAYLCGLSQHLSNVGQAHITIL